MLRFTLTVASVVALIAVLLSLRTPAEPPKPLISGRNNTVLFLTDSANGLSNVHVATSFALLENHPTAEVHYASFANLAPEIARISSFGQTKNPAAKPIVWHELTAGPDYGTSFLRLIGNVLGLMAGPGWSGQHELVEKLEHLMVPWEAEEYWALFSEMRELIDKVDPAVVVLDSMFRPAMDAARNAGRVRAIVSPNSLAGLFLTVQPRGGMFWKYPVLASGLPFPIPWRQIPANIWFQIRIIIKFIRAPRLTALRKYLSAKGIESPIDLMDMNRQDVPWLTMDFPEGGLPLDYVPPHVSWCGPIVIEAAPAEVQDAKLARWLKRAPTMLVNLGSSVKYGEDMARAMAGGLLTVLESTDTQILWKFRKVGDEYGDEFLQPLEQYIKSGRLRVESWLNIDPMSLLQTGHVAVSVHHGGANCYFEAVSAGVPQVILPLWADLYNFATTAEYLGIGIWPSKNTAPAWEAAALGEGFLKALTGETSVAMREKARAIGEASWRYGGRDKAAGIIAGMAAAGRV